MVYSPVTGVFGTQRWKCLAVLLSCGIVSSGQIASAAYPLTEGKRIYARHCVVCHGSDAQGTDRAPQLAGYPRLRELSLRQLRAIIHDGLPASGMPAFHLPAAELNAIATFVRSLNVPAAEAIVAGNPNAGERFFFIKGRCASCHMVYGRGEAIGPDLSDVGRDLSVEEIRQTLLKPETRITPGYELVTVQLRDGRTVRGFARSRGTTEIQLEDLKAEFHLLHEDRIATIKEERKSVMEPLHASFTEVQDLIAYLSGLSGVTPGPIAPHRESQANEISFSRILNPRPGDWLTYNGRLGGNRYSDLTQVNASNVQKLVMKWAFSVPFFGLEVTPLVADGVMYVTGPNQAFALDALTGRQIWDYSRPRTPGLTGDAQMGKNRGVALLGDKVFMVTDNAHLIALNRITGRVMWEAVMPEARQHYGSTTAPLVVKNLVIAGVSGADEGIRGFVAAYDASTGKRIWRRWIIPQKGDPGFETWKGDEPEFGGGSTWLTGSYDAETDTLYWPTGNPFPDFDDRERSGDNLFTDCILALNPDDGSVRWYYQFTPHDIHDWDATEPAVLVDTQYHGQERKLLLHADRNGFFYVLDRTTGQLLLAQKFVNHLTWAARIGADGRPQLRSNDIQPGKIETVCPTSATNWMSTAFSPSTRLYYVMALEDCEVHWSPNSLSPPQAQREPGQKYLRALDVETGKIAWEVPQIGPVEGYRWAGILGTAGGILFYGDPSGEFVAADERDGRRLWHFPTNQDIKASPMTFAVDGRQFIGIAAGPNILCFGLP